MTLSYVVATGATFTIPTGSVVGLTGVYATKLWDTSSSAWNAATSTFTAPAAGSYLIEASFRTNTVSTNTQLAYSQNGGALVYFGGYNAPNLSNASGPIFINTSVVVNCAANDTIGLYVFQNSGGSLTIATGSGFNTYTELSITALSGGPQGPIGPTGPTSDSVSTGASGAFNGPGTFQMKWGSVATTLSGVAVVFPVAFANSCTGVVISCNTGDIAGAYAGVSAISAAGFTATSAVVTSETYFWMAVGY
jgi:hypothetical protein